MSNDNSGSPIIRSVIAGGMGMAGTLAALGATGLTNDWKTGLVACAISLFVGFMLRMGVEYGVAVAPPG